MKVARNSKLIQSLMVAALVVVGLGYAPKSYGQDASAEDAASSPTAAPYANVTKGYEIGGDLVLATPNGASSANTALGYMALTADTTGTENTGLGNSALNSNTTGVWNTAAGQQALKWNTTGNSNTAFGWQALVNNHLAYRNTAVGVEALHNNDIDVAGLGIQNTAIGWQANFYNQDGTNNTGLGYQACLNVVEGSDVTCIGASSGPAADVTGAATTSPMSMAGRRQAPAIPWCASPAMGCWGRLVGLERRGAAASDRRASTTNRQPATAPFAAGSVTRKEFELAFGGSDEQRSRLLLSFILGTRPGFAWAVFFGGSGAA